VRASPPYAADRPGVPSALAARTRAAGGRVVAAAPPAGTSAPRRVLDGERARRRRVRAGGCLRD